MVEEMKVKDGYKKTEVGVIPEDWRVITFGEAFSFLSTGNNSRSETKEQGTIQYIHYGDIHTKWRYVLDCDNDNIPFIDEIKVKSLPKLEEGDLIIADASEDYEGIGVSVEIKNIKNRKIVSGLHTFLLRGDKRIFVDGFKGYIQAMKPVKNELRKIATGISVYGISKNNLKNVLIPVPTLSEQKAIAKALSDIDNLITSLEKLIDKKRKIKQGTMQQLLTGKKRLPGFAGEWEVKKLGDIGRAYGGLTGKNKVDFEDGNKPYIPFLNIMNNAIIRLQHLEYVKVRPSEKQNLVQKGDLFFNTSSETPDEVGMCSVLMEDVDELYLNSFCFGFRLFKKDEFEPLYLSYYFRSNEGRKLFYSLAQGATRYNLSKNAFYKMEITYPPIEEQRVISKILFDMDSEIEALEKKLEKYKAIKQGMMQELLTGRIRLV